MVSGLIFYSRGLLFKTVFFILFSSRLFFYSKLLFWCSVILCSVVLFWCWRKEKKRNGILLKNSMVFFWRIQRKAVRKEMVFFWRIQRKEKKTPGVVLLFCCSVVVLFCCSVVLLFCCCVVLLFCCSVVLKRKHQKKRKHQNEKPQKAFLMLWFYSRETVLNRNGLKKKKESIQPQVPLRLPCYDFTSVTTPTVVHDLAIRTVKTR